MKMELSAKTAKAFVKAIENLEEVCLLVFDEDGVRTRIVNSEHTALLDVRIPKDSAEVFDFQESNSVEIGVLIADIKDMTKSLVVKDTLTIEYNTGDPTWLILEANGVLKKVRCKNASLIKRHKAPPTEHKWSASIPWKQSKAFLTSCAKETSFRILVNATWIEFESKNDDETLTARFEGSDIDLHIEGESLITHITPAHFMSLMSTTSAKTVFTAKGSNGTVVETEWAESGLKLNGWIAPRT
jgi:DNA polymerase III sliding clamp (beta) subunit (PCNA family)